MYKNFLKLSSYYLIFVLCLMVSVNFFVDPGEIYFKSILPNFNGADFSYKLFRSKNGVLQNGWNERLVKTTLAKEAGEFDCVVLGSSHVMQISGVRNTGGIKERCEKLLNLGVSGGGIEDLSIFSYLIINNDARPKRVYIGIDPWTLKFEMDSRFGAYNQYYVRMNERLNSDNKNGVYLLDVVKNLINGQYFYYSILSLKMNFTMADSPSSLVVVDEYFNKEVEFPDAEFSYESGYEKTITLPDGSHLYSTDWILAHKEKIKHVKDGGGYYKIGGVAYTLSALQYMTKIIDLYIENDIEVNFVMTPYHASVFKRGDTLVVLHIKAVDEVVKKMAKKNNIKIYGSFFPEVLNCEEMEFYDFMHPTSECLGRINFSK